MKPRFAYRVIRPFIYTPAARTDISATIRRELARLGERQVVRIADVTGLAPAKEVNHE